MDWNRWHDRYDAPDSPLARRLSTVREQVRLALDDCPPGPLRVVSLCAGQGRDLLGVLPGHPRREDVRARLVELDRHNVDAALDAVRSAGLAQVEVVAGDASLLDHYAGMAPADLVLLCGVFGNITDPDIERTVDACTQLCATGGRVIWTRNRKAPDRVPLICGWFEERGFEREWVTDEEQSQSVGVHRFRGPSRPLRPGERVFTFVGYERLRPAN
ncbi:class I SAM-dependent methyltransferase [Streptomyces sp. NPDC054884]|uniref:class I SAM-dependent methyltransferase n=1 Tax=Streptomyces sp. ME08-AFT2 TaxID=3028683 RepID=UPI0029B8758F|nr:class I SAM-dependent methyltransferase [Streptomyces sp. ME08-AFT2]MDX3314109.1 class I SAM-dependent methyltransferase [Streptomyces sp. ME08-AFT2]